MAVLGGAVKHENGVVHLSSVIDDLELVREAAVQFFEVRYIEPPGWQGEVL